MPWVFIKDVLMTSPLQTPEEVTTSIEERGKGKQYQVRSRYVIACDGRRSEVRQALNIPTEGEDSDQTMMTIHFNADLRSVVKERVGMLYWILDPAAAGFIIGYNLDGNQVHISQVEVTQHPVETWTEEMCRTKIQSAIGQNVPFEIFSFRPWVFRREIATTFQVGNVFL
jgi:2-polyprenyl-6-methoxyphenol hydroxylase-like FAD-dependent oxidoreductase